MSGVSGGDEASKEDIPVQQVSSVLTACKFPPSAEYNVEDTVQESSDVNPPLKTEHLQKTLLKLHRQFGHPSQKRLKLLLKDGNLWQDEYQSDLDKVYEKS